MRVPLGPFLIFVSQVGKYCHIQTLIKTNGDDIYMNTNLTKPKKEEDGQKSKSMSTKAPLTERIMKKAAVVAVAAACTIVPISCLLDVSGTASGNSRDAGGDTDTETDAGHDADTVDADRTDGDVADSDVIDSDITDSDIVDGDISDGDVSDADEDSGVTDADISDGDVDSGPTACPGVSNDSISSENVDLGDPIEVGGYTLTYTGQAPGSDDIYIDVHCAATGDEVESNVVVPLYGTATAHAPVDGKDIEITNHSSSDTGARISATVSDS